MSKRVSQKANLLKGFIKENPLFVSILGTCPALATTRSLESAIGMGILLTIVLICSNVLISLVRKLIPDEVRTPCYIVIIATFVTIVKMLSEAFLPELYTTLGVFISLIVVNCIVLGRAEAFASKNGPGASFFDAVGMGLGYMLALIIIAIIREVLGTMSITFGEVFTFIPHTVIAIPGSSKFAISIFTMPSGGFIVFGFVLAIISAIQNSKNEKAKQKAKEAALKAKEGGTK